MGIDWKPFLSKMGSTPWLAILAAVLALATPALSSSPRVVCYYTNWSVYRPGTAKFNPQNINPYLCTHLVYAFGGFTKDNTLKPFDKYQDIEKGGYAKFTGLKTYNKNLKTLLAIGGWNEGSSRFSPLVASKERRKEFVRNVIKFLRQNHFDGLDLDWEYPAFRDGGKPKDREHYAKLVKELREEFVRESEKTGKTRLLLTMAVPAGIEYIQKGFDIRTLNKYLDWMNLLTYDYHSAFEPAVNHHAPLYPLEEPNEYSVDNELNIDYTIKFYLENGASPDKLVLGIPTYGRSYTLFNADAVEIGSPADGPGEQGDATREKGYLAFYEICEALKSNKKKRAIDSEEDSEEESEEEEEEQEWTVMHPNPNAMGPVAYKGNQWVGYDDIDIVKKKGEYVAENALGGIMFWSIDNDDFRGNCYGKPYPLIEAAKEAYIAKLGSTVNTVRQPESSKAISSSSRRKSKPRSTTTTTQKPTTKKPKNIQSSTPVWNNTPEPPTTPDPGSDFKCTDEGFFPHPRDCKKYFWCLDSGPSDLGIVAHQFTCPSGLYFNKAADSCDFARNVLCKPKPAATTKAPTTLTTKPSTTTTTLTTTTTTTRRPIRLTSRSSLLFRTSTTTTPEPISEEDVSEEEDITDEDAEDPKVIKELIDLIKKVGGVEQLEKHLRLSETGVSPDGVVTTTPANFNKKLYQKVLERARGKSKYGNNLLESGTQNSRSGPQNAGIEPSAEREKSYKKDRPQYVTINRARQASSTPEPLESLEEDESGSEEVQEPVRAKILESVSSFGTSKPLQYVNIRRPRPTTVSDSADTASYRNALFDRDPVISVSETAGSIDIANVRRTTTPEYVTIRRSRPTTEEPSTVQYQPAEQVESQETALEREISSPSLQPQYSSIIRTRSTTVTPEEINSPEPTTVLSVQISSLLNAPSPTEEIEPIQTTVSNEPETTTTILTTTTAAPTTTRRNILRRRGSTSPSTTTAATTTQSVKERRPFPRRTRPTTIGPQTETTTDIETTTRPTRRGNNKFKNRKTEKDTKEKSSSEKPLTRNEKPERTFLRRRLGGANSTTPKPVSSVLPSRRPFRVASRRRPFGPSSTTTTTTTQATTQILESEESLQDLGDTDAFEDPSLQPRNTKNTNVQRRRPLVQLKSDTGNQDQNPSATNDDKKERQSKKYSATFRQNQLDETLKGRSSGEEIEATTEVRIGTSEDYSAETAVALAAHQLIAAPVPVVQDYDEEPKTTKRPKTSQTIVDYKYTSPFYNEEFKTQNTEGYSHTHSPQGFETSTPYFKTDTASTYDTRLPYTSTDAFTRRPYSTIGESTGGFEKTTQFATNTIRPGVRFTIPDGFESTPYIRTEGTTFDSFDSTGRYDRTRSNPIADSTPFSRNTIRPSGVSLNIGSDNSGESTSRFSYDFSSTVDYEAKSRPISTVNPVETTRFNTAADYEPRVTRPRLPTNPTASSISEYPSTRKFSRPAGFSPSLLNVGLEASTLRLGPSTARYLGSSGKIPVSGSEGASQEPSYFTREYLLESPVTKAYDDEYQYLSPITTPQTTTTKKSPPRRKTIYRRISTTLKTPVAETPKPRSTRKPFEKIPEKEIESEKEVVKASGPKKSEFDYYDDDQEKIGVKYEKETKVILDGTGNIECLDIGNFPHPSSCKKFISCARIRGGSVLGWEYICPKGLSFDPVGGICNWSAGLGCQEKDL
ncbi:mucin-5AC isoform X2 [Pieris rapae]|uniref:mucin-5AC isoform X2 n=1 Tax=Pieris rapae TaxID=64459 RepID=UPI001E27FE38|nr:mucin-5AC isoform X2 [Pieris rapae]